MSPGDADARDRPYNRGESRPQGPGTAPVEPSDLFLPLRVVDDSPSDPWADRVLYHTTATMAESPRSMDQVGDANKNPEQIARDAIDGMLREAGWFEIDGRKGSQQLFAILPLIREVDRVMSPDLQARVREGHPEVSFLGMNGGKTMPHKKSSLQGRLGRLDLVEQHFPGATQRIRGISESAAAGDALDAYALLWTARRWREGLAETLPVSPIVDEHGLRMEIVY